MSWPYELRAIASIVECVASSLIVENGCDLFPAKLRPVATREIPCRYSKTPRRCDKRKHDRIGDQQRERRRVSSFQEAFSPRLTISYRTLRASAAPGIVLPSKAQYLWPLPYQWRC